MRPLRLRPLRESDHRSKAVELARAGDPDAWNAWRKETDIFGDHLRTRVNLADADLSDHKLASFSLSNASFYRADLSRSDLSGANCAYTDFHLARLFKTNLERANLKNARLTRAYLRGANLSRADLRDTDLRRASLTGAILFRADIRGTDLSATRGLDQDQVDRAIGDGFTRLPGHLRHPDVWGEYDDDVDDDDLENLRPLPASVEVSVQSGKLQLSGRPGDASFTASIDPVAVRAEILADLRRVTPRLGNAGELAAAVKRYEDALAEEAQNVIIVGLKAIQFERIFEAVTRAEQSPDSFSLISDVEGALRGVLLQHFLYISQFPEWKKFIEDARSSPFDAAHVDAARQTTEQIAGILDDEPRACDPRVPAALRRALQEIDISDDAQDYAVHNSFVSQENALKGPVVWAAKEVRRLGGEFAKAVKEDFAKYVGEHMAKLLMRLLTSAAVDVLAHSFPDWFGWLRHARDIFKLKD